MVLEFRAELRGSHVHVGVFSGPALGQLVHVGMLTFTDTEYPEFIDGVVKASRPGFVLFFCGARRLSC